MFLPSVLDAVYFFLPPPPPPAAFAFAFLAATADITIVINKNISLMHICMKKSISYSMS